MRRASEAAGVVLGGGAARRFGKPKQRLPIDGVPLIRRIAFALASCLPRTYISAADPLTASELSAISGGFPVLVDEDMPCGGPPRAMATAWRVGYRYVVLVPSDMPRLSASIIYSLIYYTLSGGEVDVSILMWGNGRLEFLLGSYSTELLRKLGRVCMIKADMLRVRAGDAARLASTLRLVPAELLSRDPRSLTHLTKQGDEYNPRVRGKQGFTYTPTTIINKGVGVYGEALRSLAEGDFNGAYLLFLEEYRVHVDQGLLHLAAQAASDAARVAGLMGADQADALRLVSEAYQRLERDEK